MKIPGLLHSYADPSAALVVDGQTLAFAEEERFLRNKHANGWFPSRAVQFVLRQAGLKITDVDVITQALNCPAYDSGEATAVYEAINARYPTAPADLAYQKKHLEAFSSGSQSGIIRRNLQQIFGDVALPPIRFVPHHLAHAAMAVGESGFDPHVRSHRTGCSGNRQLSAHQNPARGTKGPVVNILFLAPIMMIWKCRSAGAWHAGRPRGILWSARS